MRALAAVVIGLAVVAGPATAGDIASHLAATHFLARQAGFSEEDARLIASANWSLDLNANSTALPVVEPADADTYANTLGRASAKSQLPSGPGLRLEMSRSMETVARVATEYPERGGRFHMLGSDARHAHENLAALNAAARDATAGGDRRQQLIALGQYLHGLQDAYFHQHASKPYGPVIGHLIEGHDTDKVATHFDAAVRAYGSTYDVLKSFREQRRIPDAPAQSEIYRPPVREGIPRAELDALRRTDPTTGVLSLASALAGAYETTVTKVYGKGSPPRTVVTHGEPRWQDVQERTAKLWTRLNGGDASFRPIAPIDHNSPERINFETNPQWLLATRGGARAAAAPGGVSLSFAAAARLRLDFDLDAVRYTNGEIVLSGRAERGGKLDAALFVTALRLACERDDPYFSLDPPDGRQWVEQGNRAFDEISGKVESRLHDRVAALVERSPHRGAFGQGPEFVSVGVAKEYPEVWRAIASKYPELRSKLVFRPGWLARTRFGDVMYRADVLLKELSGGVPVISTEGVAPVRRLDRYASANERTAARQLLERVDTGDDTVAKRASDFAGHRLWFDITPIAEPRRPSADAWPDVASLLRGFAEGRLENPAAPGPAAELRRLLAGRGLIADAGQKPVVAAVGYEDGVLDVSAIVPRMYIRIHDHATGNDLPGSDPALDDLADDVNRRIAEYTRQYPELQELTEIFRGYVGAVKLAQQDRGICERVHALPLLRAERAAAALPDFHPSDISITASALRRADGTTVGFLGGAISGGVTLGVKSASAGLALRATASTRTTREALAGGERPAGAVAWAAAGDPGRRFAALTLDAAGTAADLEHLRGFRPVTAEDVLSDVPREGDASSLGRTVRRTLATVFGYRAIGIPLCIVLVVAVFAGIGFAKDRFDRFRGKA